MCFLNTLKKIKINRNRQLDKPDFCPAMNSGSFESFFPDEIFLGQMKIPGLMIGCRDQRGAMKLNPCQILIFSLFH